MGLISQKRDKKSVMQQKIKIQLRAKKVKKVEKLNGKPHGAKLYKKHMLLKKYEEDKTLEAANKLHYDNLVVKYRALRDKYH